MTEAPILEVTGLTKYYESGGSVVENLLGRSRQVRAVDGVDLELHPGETLGVVGESGCGKTTLGRALLRLVEPTAGSVVYRRRRDDGSTEEIELTDLSGSNLRDLRRDLQYIFQDPFASLDPRLTVGDIVGEPLDIHGLASGQARTERIHDLLDTVGLSASHAKRYPHEFSGGQRQRIGIARALAVEPQVIVCDEPVSALDVSIQAQILNLLEDLQAEFDLSYLFIAHDLSVVEHISDRVAVMYLGEIAEVGATDDLYATPRHPYSEALLSVIPEPDPGWEGEKILLSGEVPSALDPPEGCRFHTRCHRVIPPESVDLDQSTVRSLLDVKLRAREAASASELVSLGTDGQFREDLAAEGPRAVDDAVRSAYGLPATLPDPDVERKFEEAMAALAADGPTAAKRVLEAAFVSPCETVRPDLVPVGDTQAVACLRYDETTPGSPPEDVVPGSTRDRSSGPARGTTGDTPPDG